MDKIILNTMPTNFIYIPLIKAIAPRAKIIWCHREPQTHCINMFIKSFKHEAWNFTNSIDRIVETYQSYQRIYQFYKEKMPDNFIDVQYEDMMKDPKKTLSTLLENAGYDIPASALKKAIQDNQSYLNVIEAEHTLLRNYTPYFPELHTLL